ncbi:MAG TPA: FecR family protein [bacterium]|nr:FecR family protein [bacterium]
MAKFFVFFGVVIFGLLGAGAWFVYSATSFPIDDWQGTVQLQVEKGQVYVKQGNLEYQLVKEDLTLATGDSVKTSDNSAASIVVGEGAVMRLDANTELTINQAEMSSMWEQQVNVKVSEGKIWFRILKLFNDQSQWEVETPTVVATVRGTAFSIGTEELFVGESQVAVKDKRLGNRGKEVLVGLGEAMQFVGDGRDNLQKIKLGRDKLDDNLKQWVDKNFKNDGSFQKLARERVNTRLKKYMGAEPGTLKYKLQQTAENIREKFIDDEQTKARWENFKQQRRLAEGAWLAEKGDANQLRDFLKDQKLDKSLREKVLPELLGEDKLDWQKIMPEREMPDRIFDWNQFDNTFERLNRDLDNLNFNFDMSGLDAWMKYQTDNPEYFRLIKAYTDKWSNIDYTDPAQIQAMINSPEYLNLMRFFSQMSDDLPLQRQPLDNSNDIELLNVRPSTTTTTDETLTTTGDDVPMETLEPGQTQVVEEEPEPPQEPVDDEIILDFTF